MFDQAFPGIRIEQTTFTHLIRHIEANRAFYTMGSPHVGCQLLFCGKNNSTLAAFVLSIQILSITTVTDIIGSGQRGGANFHMLAKLRGCLRTAEIHCDNVHPTQEAQEENLQTYTTIMLDGTIVGYQIRVRIQRYLFSTACTTRKPFIFSAFGATTGETVIPADATAIGVSIRGWTW